MKRVLGKGWLPLFLAAVLVVSATPLVRAGIGDKLKKKAEDKANKEADKVIDTTDGEADKSEESNDTGEQSKAAPKGSGDVAGVSTKFDFVPGDKLLLYDDFSQDELGEFPAHFKLNAGTVETAEMNGERWCRLAGDYGRIRPKVAGLTGLPELWTLEFDAYTSEVMANSFEVLGIVEGNVVAWVAVFGVYGNTITFQSGSVQAQATYEAAKTLTGRHHIMVMARGTALKIYVDTQRVVNIPEVASKSSEIELRMSNPASKPMLTNVRFAEGPKPIKDPFADGKLVTYGIYFDSGSDVVKPESALVLRQIAAYLEKNAAVKVQIVGHTDNQGTADGNVDLSKRRSASVAKVLETQFKLAADRFQTDGKGDTVPISQNETSEGRATNRRVEFMKI